MPIGQCAPQRSASAPTPAAASMRSATARWLSSPLCDAAASASASASMPSASHAPDCTSGSACSGLITERVNVTSSGSPSAWVTRPAASTTATQA
jgi:hypothetical protein